MLGWRLEAAPPPTSPHPPTTSLPTSHQNPTSTKPTSAHFQTGRLDKDTCKTSHHFTSPPIIQNDPLTLHQPAIQAAHPQPQNLQPQSKPQSKPGLNINTNSDNSTPKNPTHLSKAQAHLHVPKRESGLRASSSPCNRAAAVWPLVFGAWRSRGERESADESRGAVPAVGAGVSCAAGVFGG